MWGCQWDQMLKIIYASDNTKSLTDSSSWGNYLNVTFEYEDNGTKTKNINTDTRIPTGSTERNKAYNIYDVAGNRYDWTLTASGNGRVLFGGSDYESGSTGPASYRGLATPERR